MFRREQLAPTARVYFTCHAFTRTRSHEVSAISAVVICLCYRRVLGCLFGDFKHAVLPCALHDTRRSKCRDTLSVSLVPIRFSAKTVSGLRLSRAKDAASFLCNCSCERDSLSRLSKCPDHRPFARFALLRVRHLRVSVELAFHLFLLRGRQWTP
jgi:hypothetical protein